MGYSDILDNLEAPLTPDMIYAQGMNKFSRWLYSFWLLASKMAQ